VTTYDLILIGFGNVARRFVSLLDEKRAFLARQGVAARVVGIVTRSHGCSFKGRKQPYREADTVLEFIARSQEAARDKRLVLVETTTLDITRGEPATTHVRTGLAGGAHVITANKGPAAFAYRSLAKAARLGGRRFLFEGSVMDGIPIFNLARETLRGVDIAGFRGVVNTTTNHILTAMEQGRPFAEALAEMQATGIAEADASLDLDGWDAAAKTAALANALLDARITPHEVEREGITPETGRRAVGARAAHRRLKLVARAAREGDRISARVALEELPENDLLASLEGRQNGIVFQTDLLGEMAVVQRGSGLTQTAYALLSDFMTIAGERVNVHSDHRPPVSGPRARPRPRATARRRRNP
jgi:homoserine dehydrogenase